MTRRFSCARRATARHTCQTFQQHGRKKRGEGLDLSPINLEPVGVGGALICCQKEMRTRGRDEKKEGEEEVGISEDLQHVKPISAAPGRNLQTPELSLHSDDSLPAV